MFASMFDPAGNAAREIVELTVGLLVLGSAVFVLFLVAMTLAMRRHDADASTTRPHPSGVSGRAPRFLVLGGGIVLPTVMIIGVFAWTVETMRDIPTTAPRDALTIEVTGHQWWWEITYPTEGVEVANELHLPVGRTVELRIESSDVIHSVWIPALGGKMDAIPARTNVLVVTVDRTGEFDGRCAEFCGLHHAQMELDVTAHEPAAFERWLAEHQPGTTGSGATDD